MTGLEGTGIKKTGQKDYIILFESEKDHYSRTSDMALSCGSPYFLLEPIFAHLIETCENSVR